MTSTSTAVLRAQDEATVRRIGLNLTAYQRADHCDRSTGTRYAAMFAINIDELLEIVARLTGPAA